MINVDRKEFYYSLNQDIKERTRNRLIQMNELGMELVGSGQFGIPEIMSGLYIEKVWNYSDKDFDEYLDWVKQLIKEKSGNEQNKL